MKKEELEVECQIVGNVLSYRITNNTDASINITKVEIINAVNDGVIYCLQQKIETIEANSTLERPSLLDVKDLLNLYNLSHRTELRIKVYTKYKEFESVNVKYC